MLTGQTGCAGRHHGTGAPGCPRELHHHHDERCLRAAEHAEHAEQERQAARGDEIMFGVDTALPVVIDVNTLAQHRRHADLGESAAGCPFCPAVVALARGGIVRMVVAEPAHEGSPACRHCAAAIEPYPASGTGWIHALSALVGCGPKGISLADQHAAEPARPSPCICRGNATAVCFDRAGVSCPRGALLHAAAYLPTLDELREQREGRGQ